MEDSGGRSRLIEMSDLGRKDFDHEECINLKSLKDGGIRLVELFWSSGN